MKKLKIFLILMMLVFTIYSCKEEVDKEKPEIDISFQGAFHQNCDTLYFGETFTLKLRFADNQELGSYSFDIHHNFDHHSHSTEMTECYLDPVKQPVHPYLLIQDYPIPSGLNGIETTQSIYLPSGDENGLYDEGDYHLFMQLTDKEGWSSQKGLSIKILH